MADLHLSLSLLPDKYAVCRLEPTAAIPEWVKTGPFFSITRTKDELSLVCLQNNVVEGVSNCEKDWRCLQIAGPLDFSLVGILSNLLAPLAEAGISIFAVSTYDTDYVFIKNNNLESAIDILTKAGHLLNFDG